MKTGNTLAVLADAANIHEPPQWSPVMKTGNTIPRRQADLLPREPQWSPVMKTGNTHHTSSTNAPRQRASMEPGHEDREYVRGSISYRPTKKCLNGARS